MKASVNYNLEGDEEPGVFGRAQNLKFTISSNRHALLNLGSNCQASKHNYLRCFCHIGTPEAPQEVNISHLGFHHVSYTSIWSRNLTQSGTMQAISEAYQKRLSETCNVKQKPASKTQGPQNYEGQGQERTHVCISTSHCDQA